MLDRTFVTELFACLTLNLVLGSMTSALETNLCFLMGFTFWTVHFSYYFFTFSILLFACLCGFAKRDKVPWTNILQLVAAEMVFSISSSAIHHGGSDGAVNSIHVVDCLSTIGILLGSRFILDSDNSIGTTDISLLVVLGLFSSMCWMESIIYVTPLVLVMWPLLAISRSFIYFLAFKTFQQYNTSFVSILLYVCGLCAILSLPLAVLFKSDKFNEGQENFGLDRLYSFITPELVIVLSAIPLFFGTTCTNYWLMFNCKPDTFLIVYHTKFLLGSIGASLISAMAYNTIYSTIGKACASIVIALLYYRKWKAYKEELVVDSNA